MNYNFKPEIKKQIIDDIIYFFDKEHDEKIGIVASENIMDFFIELLGDKIYNMALDDAKKFYEKYVSEMNIDYYALYREELK